MDTIFHKMMRGEAPADFVYEDDQCIAIRDIYPREKTHLLIIPRTTISCLAEAQSEHQALLGHLLLVSKGLAHRLGCGDAFYLRIHSGEDAGMTVHQLHIHLLSPRDCAEIEKPLTATDISL